MSKNLFCDICGKFKYLTIPHKCPPKWQVCEYDEEDVEFVDVYADTAEEAAKEFAADYDRRNGDFDIANGDDVKIKVQSVGGDRSYWLVSGESIPEYYAKEEHEPF